MVDIPSEWPILTDVYIPGALATKNLAMETPGIHQSEIPRAVLQHQRRRFPVSSLPKREDATSSDRGGQSQ